MRCGRRSVELFPANWTHVRDSLALMAGMLLVERSGPLLALLRCEFVRVKGQVCADRKLFEILRRIVERVPVDVMNMLAGLHGIVRVVLVPYPMRPLHISRLALFISPQIHLCPMLWLAMLAIGKRAVPCWPAAFPIAVIGAKPRSLSKRSDNLERLPALFTLFRLPWRPFGSTETRARTIGRRCLRAGPRKTKRLSTVLACPFVDRHSGIPPVARFLDKLGELYQNVVLTN